jgi:hypothetical protein
MIKARNYKTNTQIGKFYIANDFEEIMVLGKTIKETYINKLDSFMQDVCKRHNDIRLYGDYILYQKVLSWHSIDDFFKNIAEHYRI